MPRGRKAVVAEIGSIVTPRMRDSGYRKALDPSKGLLAGSRPLRVWVPDEPMQLDGYVLTDVVAITEDGVMTDATGGGCVTESWNCFPLEDLQLLLTTLRRVLG